MTLQDAIDYIKSVSPEDDPWTAKDFAFDLNDEFTDPIDTAIAAVLNAIVKGEL